MGIYPAWTQTAIIFDCTYTLIYEGFTESNAKVGVTFLLTYMAVQILHVGRVTLKSRTHERIF